MLQIKPQNDKRKKHFHLPRPPKRKPREPRLLTLRDCFAFVIKDVRMHIPHR